MNFLSKLIPAAVSALALTAATTVCAGPIVAGINNITNAGGALVLDVNKNAATGGPNSVAAHLTWLTSQVTAFNAIAPVSALPAPTGGTDVGSAFTGNVNVSGYTYATLHYGGGAGGGGLVAYYLNGITSFNFPDNGLGPNGDGGLSTLYLFGPTPTTGPGTGVPDGGSVVLMLGSALVGMAILRRFLKSA